MSLKKIYQERPAQRAIGFEAYTMLKPSWAIVKFLVEPGIKGSGYLFFNQANNNQVLPSYHKQIEENVVESLKIGRFGGYSHRRGGKK